MKNFTNLSRQLARNLFLVGAFCLGSITGAKAVITLTFATSSTMYVPGQNNNLSFTVTGVGSEWVDRLTLVFPAGFTVNSATPTGGTGGCATQVGLLLTCSPMVSWCTATGAVCGTAPMGNSFCGFWQAGTQTLTANVAIPAAFSGPLVVMLNSKGESGGTDLDQVTIAQALPFVPCVMTCPANLTVNLDPGACDAIVSYPLPTLTGDCFTGSLVNGFQGVFAPSAINYYQYDAGIFTNPPTPFTNAYAVAFNSPTNTTLTLKSADFGFSPGPNFYFFNGCEWINTTGANANVSFNWTYNTNDGAFWDQFQYLIGTAANSFANNNFGNQLANWTGISNDNGGTAQNGALAIVIP
ncbi:MAG TPA: hypothetical protein VN763_11580, partial [Saprospiraceae bacterium]|nr:hypothetical protein [Saprospiraceae bacterium]